MNEDGIFKKDVKVYRNLGFFVIIFVFIREFCK